MRLSTYQLALLAEARAENEDFDHEYPLECRLWSLVRQEIAKILEQLPDGMTQENSQAELWRQVDEYEARQAKYKKWEVAHGKEH